jgi:hypothetical protein
LSAREKDGSGPSYVDPNLGLEFMARGASRTAEVSLRADDKTEWAVEGEEPDFPTVAVEVAETGANRVRRVI